MQSGLRIEEALDLTTLDVLRRELHSLRPSFSEVDRGTAELFAGGGTCVISMLTNAVVSPATVTAQDATIHLTRLAG